jgi:ATP adenylyltransferase
VEHLWSPWRLEYVTRGDTGSGCIFCAKQTDLVVFEGSVCYVILNLYPYNNGHLMIVPQRHVGMLGELTPVELTEIGTLTQRAETALMEAYQPHGLNVGINLGKPAGAGILEHLHVHVVPRWSGDTNFMTVVGEMRVLPEDLGASAARLRPIFAKLASGA